MEPATGTKQATNKKGSTMKTKRHFIYAETKTVFSRTYGGRTYTLTIWENKGRGKLVKLGETQACSRGHKGEDSEAWGFIFANAFSKRQRAAMMQHPDANPPSGGSLKNYWNWRVGEDLGIKMDRLY